MKKCIMGFIINILLSKMCETIASIIEKGNRSIPLEGPFTIWMLHYNFYVDSVKCYKF